MSALDKAEGGAVLLLAAVAAFVLWKVAKAAPEAVKSIGQAAGGVVTGNNAITQNATNADGEHTSAYEGKGIVGTAGAAANATSGGYLASWGEDLGRWVFDMTHEDYNPNAPAPRNTGGASGSW